MIDKTYKRCRDIERVFRYVEEILSWDSIGIWLVFLPIISPLVFEPSDSNVNSTLVNQQIRLASAVV